jgi:hypothetical protein
MPGSSQHALVIIRDQMRREQTDRRQVQRAVTEQFKNARPFPRGPGRLDSEVRGVFGQVQDLGTVGEERGAALGEIEPARIQLAQCRISLAVACCSSEVSRLTSSSSSASDSRDSSEISFFMLFSTIVVSTPCRCARLSRLAGDPAAMLVVTEKSAPGRDKGAEALFVARVASKGTNARNTCQVFS